MELFIALILVAVSLLIVFVKYKLSYWTRRGIPHDKPCFPYGNLKGILNTKHFNELIDPVYYKYKGTGPFAGFYFFIGPGALATDLDFIKNVLIKDFNKFDERGVFHNERDDPLTGNLFFLDGPKWRKLRHKISQTFTSGKMKNMYPTVMEIAERFVDVFGKRVQESDNGVLEITNLFGRYTADVIGLCAFGLDCNSLYNPKADFVVMGKRAMIDRNHNKLIDGFINAMPGLARTLRMCQTHPDIEKFYMGIVRETIEYREKNKVKRNDFMNMLLELKNVKSDDKIPDGKSEIGLTFNEIAAQCFIFYVAGFETSSTTMSFALFELAQNEDIQNKLREEINDVLRKHNNELTYDCIQDMHYLDRIISETLRKYPVIPLLMRKAITRYETSDPKYYIGKGDVVIIPVHAIHHDPDIYPDPESFNPDRFTPEEIQKRPACSWLPFGDGPRNCIGLRFGKMQAITGLASLIRKYKFSPCKETPKEISFDKKYFSLSVQSGIWLKAQKI